MFSLVIKVYFYLGIKVFKVKERSSAKKYVIDVKYAHKLKYLITFDVKIKNYTL